MPFAENHVITIAVLCGKALFVLDFACIPREWAVLRHTGAFILYGMLSVEGVGAGRLWELWVRNGRQE